MKAVSILALGAVLMNMPAMAEPSALVALATARQEQLAPEIVTYGVISSDPNNQTAIIAGHDARVSAVFVRQGQAVKKGDPLFAIQNAPSASAQYAQAASALAFTANDLQQTERLYKEQLATRSQLAAARRAYADAQSAMTQQQRMGADRTVQTFTAPVDGVVISLGAARGDAVAAGGTMATIAGPAGLVVDMGLEPTGAPSVRVGAPVWLKAAGGGETIKTTVSSVGFVLDTQSRLVTVVARLPNFIASRFVIGTTVDARIGLSSRNGIVVPCAALLSGSSGTFVFTVSQGVAHRRVVAVAFQSGDRALISRGLKVGEQVVVAGMTGLTDGMHVRTR